MKPVIPMPTAAKLHSGGKQRRFIGRVLRSNRCVLGLALTLAVLVPELTHRYAAFMASRPSSLPFGLEPILIAFTFAIAVGHLSLERLGVMPLISAKGLIVPTFFVTFSFTLLALFAIKAPVGRYHTLTAFPITVIWYFVVAALRDRLSPPTIGLIGVQLPQFGDLPPYIAWKLIKNADVDPGTSAVVVDPHAKLDLQWSHFLTRLVLEGVPVYHRSHIEEGLSGKVRFHSHADNDFGALLPSLTYRKTKRVFDVLIAFLALAPVNLVIFIAAIFIKLEDPGPAFFMQTRRGFRGRPFDCYKLRTMRLNCDGPDYTVEGDERITKVGRFLRKTRIDELPQVYNILKGEMSWIGPRPEATSLAELYAANVPFYDYRHAVYPGITGWAAVHQGNVALIDAAKEKLAYDFYYIKYFSFWLDILIALKTVRIMISGFGSR